MLKAKRRVNRRTAMIRLESRYFQARAELAGELVEIRWYGAHPQELEIWIAGKLVDTARQTIISTNIDFSRRPDRNRREKPGLTLGQFEELSVGADSRARWRSSESSATSR